jgi:hypothetical protein
MSTEARDESPREHLLAEVYAQPEAGARDRERAVERFMQARQATLRRPRRVSSRRLAAVAALAVCALSTGLAWKVWVESEAALQAFDAARVTLEVEPVMETASHAATLEAIEVGASRLEESAPYAPASLSASAVREAEMRRSEPRSALPARRLEPTAHAATRAPLAPDTSDPASSSDVASTPEESSAPPALLDLESPITLAAPSAERLRELESQRGNDMAEVLPALGAETVDPCAEPERVGAAVPPEALDEGRRADARCPGYGAR